MTQLTLGLDRDSGMELLAADFDERDDAVKFMLRRAIKACLAANKYVGICGQGPSDHPDFAQWLKDEGILSMSLNPGYGGGDLAATGQVSARQQEKASPLRRGFFSPGGAGG
ncbi:phosphoenolpyruvate synthase [Bordetella pertussis]|uniref:putative PEP-binding protein n=1 Tax=Bordetella pertussis TaxID=520 RepID=UPI000E19F44B|nr:putative PEP-binding protein [Bordetella pertussis]SUW05969.1 phosphoenolpyruvate synthase [Bordetella pertussis]